MLPCAQNACLCLIILRCNHTTIALQPYQNCDTLCAAGQHTAHRCVGARQRPGAGRQRQRRVPRGGGRRGRLAGGVGSRGVVAGAAPSRWKLLRREITAPAQTPFIPISLQVDCLLSLRCIGHCPMALGARQLGGSAAPAFAAGWPTPPAQQPQCGACIGGWGSFGANASYCTMCSPGSYSPAAFSPACPACPLVRGTSALQLA